MSGNSGCDEVVRLAEINRELRRPAWQSKGEQFYQLDAAGSTGPGNWRTIGSRRDR